jgi:hypothetical protein
MLTNDAEKCDPIKHKHILAAPNAFFIVGLVLVSLVDANLVHKLWIKPKYAVGPLYAFTLQFVFLMPFLAISTIWHRIEKQMSKEEISPSFADALSILLLGLLVMVYSAFSLFMDIVPR